MPKIDDDQRLSGALQENILVLLCFDDGSCKLLRAALTPKLFESAPLRTVAEHAMDFIDQYGEAIKEHLPDSLEDILQGDDARKASTYKRLLDNLYLSRDSVNVDYTIAQLHKFVRLQTLKAGFVKAVEAFEDGNIDAAESVLTKCLNAQSVAFEAGLSMANADDVMSVFDNPEEEGFELGIPELDRDGIIPRRKELFLFMAARGRGKSWFLTHTAKAALKARWGVLIVTLEMSEKRYAARMLQSFFSISKRDTKVRVTKLLKDRGGNLQDVLHEEINRPSMADADIRQQVRGKVNRILNRRKLMIKEFATGTLTIPMLRAYLEGLERHEKFTPDVILIDYPDLMEVDTQNLRVELGQIFAKLRGIGVERNCAIVAVTQGNRDAEKATTITADMAAEDISKLGTADVFITYSQTLAEKALGLARLLVDKARNEESKWSLLITQAYGIGQFCLDSVKLSAEAYWEFMGDRKDKDSGSTARRRKREEEDDV